jgi:hypothetical protein
MQPVRRHAPQPLRWWARDPCRSWQQRPQRRRGGCRDVRRSRSGFGGRRRLDLIRGPVARRLVGDLRDRRVGCSGDGRIQTQIRAGVLLPSRCQDRRRSRGLGLDAHARHSRQGGLGLGPVPCRQARGDHDPQGTQREGSRPHGAARQLRSTRTATRTCASPCRGLSVEVGGGWRLFEAAHVRFELLHLVCLAVHCGHCFTCEMAACAVVASAGVSVPRAEKATWR